MSKNAKRRHTLYDVHMPMIKIDIAEHVPFILFIGTW